MCVSLLVAIIVVEMGWCNSGWIKELLCFSQVIYSIQARVILIVNLICQTNKIQWAFFFSWTLLPTYFFDKINLNENIVSVVDLSYRNPDIIEGALIPRCLSKLYKCFFAFCYSPEDIGLEQKWFTAYRFFWLCCFLWPHTSWGHHQRLGRKFWSLFFYFKLRVVCLWHCQICSLY